MDPSFDTWTSIFLIAAGQGFFLALLLFLKSGLQGRRFLAPLILVFSITLVEYVGFWTGYRFEYPHFTMIAGPLTFLYGPLFYFYIRDVIGDEHELNWKHSLHALPFVAIVLFRLPYLTATAAQKVAVMSGDHSLLILSPLRLMIINWLPWIKVAVMILYAVLAAQLIKNHKDRLSYSSSRVLKVILGSYVGFVLAFSSFYIMVATIGYVMSYDYAISFMMSAFIYLIGYLSFSGRLSDLKSDQAEKYKHSTLSDFELSELSDKVIRITRERQLYLNRELSLDMLAEEAGLSRHNLSQILNDRIGKSFSEFINEQRVEEAKLILKREDLNLNMLGVAYESGFNNKASFNSSFKKYTGFTPSQYRKSKLRKSVQSD